MNAQLAYLKYRIDTSFWFLPGLMTVCSFALAFIAVSLDRSLIGSSLYASGWLYAAEPENARQLLVTIAGSMITVTSLVFSMTLVALTLASQQLGPRLLTSFMRDRANQSVLGIFIATFIYSLLVLGTVSSASETEFVPYCSVVVAIALSVTSFGVLIYFFHHVAQSMQADFVIAQVARNLTESIESYFPGAAAANGGDTSDSPVPLDEGRFADAAVITGRETGYVQAVDIDALRALAETRNLTIRLDCRAGHFVVEACPIAAVVGSDPSDTDLQDAVTAAIVIGPKRTPTQDVEYEIRALVEIALRALSPGINDQYTAITCIDRLGAGLVGIMQRSAPNPFVRGDGGRVLLVQDTLDFRGALDAAFHDIRQNARGSTAVIVRLVETLTLLSRFAKDEAQRRHLRRHAAMIERVSQEFVFDPNDREDVKQRLIALNAGLADAG